MCLDSKFPQTWLASTFYGGLKHVWKSAWVLLRVVFEGPLKKFHFKPGFQIVVSVVSVVRKKFIGQIQLYGNLPYKCSIQKKRQIQLVRRDRMNAIGPMNFFRTTDTTATTDKTIWKPGFTNKKVNHSIAVLISNWKLLFGPINYIHDVYYRRCFKFRTLWLNLVLWTNFWN